MLCLCQCLVKFIKNQGDESSQSLGADSNPGLFTKSVFNCCLPFKLPFTCILTCNSENQDQSTVSHLVNHSQRGHLMLRSRC